MLWETVQGQARAVDLLRRSISQDRVVSGYLFTGPEGVGKSLAATVFAQALNCPVRPGQGCGECPACREIAQGGYPDLHRLTPSSKSRLITVDQIREMRRSVYQSARGDNWKIFLLEEADRMNLAAQNAFLKTLEEPPPKTVLILITSQPGRLLSTIRSRCQVVSFAAWPLTLMKPFIEERTELSGDQCAVLHALSAGCPGRALRYHREDILETRREVIGPLFDGPPLSARAVSELAETWLDICDRIGRAAGRHLKKEVTRRDQDLDARSRQELEKQDKARIAAAELAGLDLIFQLIFIWIRDLFLYSSLGPPAPLINRDLSDQVARSARRFTVERLRLLPGKIAESHRWAVRAVGRSSRRLVLENMLIELGFWIPSRRAG